MGSIVTFYSYKGGVGRTMALANVAVLLAQQNKRVLTVDWDLEAPGLERYFSNFRIAAEGAGLLPMCMDYRENKDLSYQDYLSTFELTDGIEVSLLSSGREHDTNYSQNLEMFDWNQFFSEDGAGDFLENLRDRWMQDFDIVLIDSRTGLSDTGGICTILLPDIIVAMFTANHQSIYGVRDVMQLAQEARQKLAYDRAALTVLPLPTRFGSTSEFSEAQTWIETIGNAFLDFYSDWLPAWAEVTDVVQQLKVPQIDYFGFGEKLAVVEQGSRDPQGMGFVYDKVAMLLDNDFQNAGDILSLREKNTPLGVGFKPIEKRFISTKSRHADHEYAFDVFVSSADGSMIAGWIGEFIDRISWRLESHGFEPRIFHDRREIETGELWESQITAALSSSKLLLAFLSGRYFRSPWAAAEWATFETREKLVGSPLIVPILMRGDVENLPGPILNRQMFDVRDYISTSQHFWDSKMAFELESKVIDRLARDLVILLERVPLRDPDWPVAEPNDQTLQAPPRLTK